MDTCPFWGPLVQLFWISGDVFSGFQKWVLPYGLFTPEFFLSDWEWTGNWSHWVLLTGFTSPLSICSKYQQCERAIIHFFMEGNVMYITWDATLVLHVLNSCQPALEPVTSHMHQQWWDLAQIRTGNCPDRRRMHYHCASDPTFLRFWNVLPSKKTWMP